MQSGDNSLDPTPTDQSVFEHLTKTSVAQTAQQIAEAIGSGPAHVRERADEMVEAGLIGRRDGHVIVGLEVPTRSKPVVLATREMAEDVVRESDVTPMRSLDAMDLYELTEFVEDRIATGRVELQVTRHKYVYDPDEHRGLG